VARDARGSTAAATSTGGLADKASGRVGDSAVVGAGTYADDRLGAGSATGPGEAIIRGVLVHTALVLVGRGLDPAWVAQHALALLARRTGADAGLVLVDPAGHVGLAHTTAAMPGAYRTDESGRVVVL
jgi:beta-aspartyl-peptidase (threonine type)